MEQFISARGIEKLAIPGQTWKNVETGVAFNIVEQCDENHVGVKFDGVDMIIKMNRFVIIDTCAQVN